MSKIEIFDDIDFLEPWENELPAPSERSEDLEEILPAVKPKEKKPRKPRPEYHSDPQFMRCFQMFRKHGTPRKAFGYWLKYTQADRDAIEKRIPAYIASRPDIQYQKMFEGWLNPKNRIWENSLPTEIQNRVLRHGDVNERGYTISTKY